MSQHTLDLWDAHGPDRRCEPLAPGAAVLHGFASDSACALLQAIDGVTAAAPLRHLTTPGGLRMSVAMTNCGPWGWTSDRQGYRYVSRDPASGLPWPTMPVAFTQLAQAAARECHYGDFEPDACLINCYEPGARLTLHQDKDERRYDAPIVSVSLGLPATFLFGGDTRTERPQRVPLRHGDVVLWGGPSRLRFHGILPLKAGYHAAAGARRLNLTFRRAM